MVKNHDPHRILFLLLGAGFLLALAIAPASALELRAGSPPSAPPSISQGDPVRITGTATGQPSAGLQIWLIGNNYARVTTVPVNPDTSFEYEITGDDTRILASGQYFVLIQHPMMNGLFDITYDAGAGTVINRQPAGSTGEGTAIFQLTGSGGLQAPAAASALVSAAGSQNIDDTFTTVSFYVEPPATLIDPIPDHAVGDRFTITGTTNLAAGDNLMVEIYSASFGPTTKQESAEFSGAGGMVQVERGGGRLNRWSFDLDASTFKPDEYIITVSAVLQDVRESSTFRIVEQAPVTTPATVSATSQVTPAPTTAPAQPPATPAPVSLAAILAGLVLAAVLWCGRGYL